MKAKLLNTNTYVTAAMSATLFAGGYAMRRDFERHKEYEASMLQQGFVKESNKHQNTNPPVVVTALGGFYSHEDRCSMWVKKSASGNVEVPYDTSYVNQKF
jgi:hypothetical protein